VGVGEPRLESATVLAYHTAQPRLTNPAVVAGLVAAGAAIVSLTCATATLEEVYAAALGRPSTAGSAG